jgi:glutathione S-transferase
LPQAIINKPT